MISYKKLFLLMEEQEITKEKLKNKIGISSATMAKLSKNEDVSMSTIQSLCDFFDCQPGAILSYEKEIDKNTTLFRLREEMEMKLKGGLYHQTQIRIAYNSNHMEGSRLTEEQTRSIYETKTIGITDGVEKVDDIIETVNHFRCFDYILDTIDEPISEKLIKELHRKLKSGIITDDDSAVVGDYKKYPNTVGEITTTLPEELSGAVRALIEEFSHRNAVDMYDVAEFHAEFEKIHPFYDGNGRIGRLLTLKMCLQNGIVPFIISDQMKHFYYAGLKEWQIQQKYTRLIDVFLESQDDMKAALDYFRIDYDHTEVTARELINKRK